ncbi:MAG: tRNA 2-thiouridine(34) synthase MnmA [Thermoleophilia bacterium]|nr:tRNA 2-thiouridine(34) synthase MnmA [Thermoleophilia bacterium]
MSISADTKLTRLSPPPGDNTILVGMSGGVDSTVAALLLKEWGWKVTGITLRLWSDPRSTDLRVCRSPEAEKRAKAAAEKIGVPHLIVDAEKEFYEAVVKYFVAEYARGRTPNPCCKCNARFRFAFMLRVAESLGIRQVATGHYARLVGEARRLARAADLSKDQSYVLAEVAPSILQRFVFPVGILTKSKVRSIARTAGLGDLVGPESQEICFVPDNDYRRFLRERIGEMPGEIVDTKGNVLGFHSGTYNFTVGQRRGVGVSCGEPVYVVAIDAPARRVVVGTRSQAQVRRIELEDVVWHRSPSEEQLRVQVRSTGESVPAKLLADGRTVLLLEPAVGVAPGQTAVVYENELVCLAGTICSTSAVNE